MDSNNIVQSVCKNDIIKLEKIYDDKQKDDLSKAKFSLPYFFIFFLNILHQK